MGGGWASENEAIDKERKNLFAPSKKQNNRQKEERRTKKNVTSTASTVKEFVY